MKFQNSSLTSIAAIDVALSIWSPERIAVCSKSTITSSGRVLAQNHLYRLQDASMSAKDLPKKQFCSSVSSSQLIANLLHTTSGNPKSSLSRFNPICIDIFFSDSFPFSRLSLLSYIFLSDEKSWQSSPFQMVKRKKKHLKKPPLFCRCAHARLTYLCIG